MIHLRPDLTDADELQDLLAGRPIITSITQGKVFYVRPRHLHVTLAGGDTRVSSVNMGRVIVESSTVGLADFLAEPSWAPWSPNFPCPPTLP